MRFGLELAREAARARGLSAGEVALWGRFDDAPFPLDPSREPEADPETLAASSRIPEFFTTTRPIPLLLASILILWNSSRFRACSGMRP